MRGAKARSRVSESRGEPPAPALRRQALSDAGDDLARLRRDLDDRRSTQAALPHLRRALAAMRQDRFEAVIAAARQAVAADPKSSHGWHLIGMAGDRLGRLQEALEAFEKALALAPENLDILNNLARLAYRMKMLPQARALFDIYLQRRPDCENAANNLGCVLRDMLLFDEAVETLRPAIEANPLNAPLWNTLGTVLAEKGEMEQAALFLDESLRLDPGFAKARYNRATARLALGEAAEAAIDCEAAIAVATVPEDAAMMRFARATMLLASGDLSRGWEAYEARFDEGYVDPPHFLVDRPRWKPGDALAGKRLMLFGEQGLGDEVLFANMIPDLTDALGPDGELVLAVERRLVPLFRRSFPDVEVGAHVTTRRHGRILRAAPFVGDWSRIDLWSPLGSPLRELRTDIEAFPETRGGYLRADPERIAHWRTRLGAMAQGDGPTVGLLWTSALITAARHRYFAPFEAWEPLLRTPGATFVNLQYGDCTAEIAHAAANWGVRVIDPPDIDLKQDLDKVAALSCAVDLTIGPANATSNIAAACGAPLWLIATPGAWPRLGTERYPWYPQARVFTPPAFGDWPAVMARLSDALAEFVEAFGTPARGKG